MDLDACHLAPESWLRLSINDVCARITSGGTPSRKKSEFYEKGTIPWVKTKELNDCLIYQTEESITQSAVKSSSAKILPKETILMAMYGATVGMLGILGHDMACNQACCAMLTKPGFDRDYLFYQLLAHRNQLQNLATGAAQQNLSGQQIKNLRLPFPSYSEQKAIGELLRLLDDRITLLRETNKTLESIAQAIFKSWFVDFDPVHAKMAGRQPEGMDEATVALFPDSFEESGLRLIPRGWKAGILSDISTLNPESWTTKNHPDRIFYIDLANTKENTISKILELNFKDSPSRARRILRAGDSIIGTVRPGNRSFAFIHDEFKNLTGSTGFAALRPKLDVFAEFIYLSATQESSIDYLSRRADGGAYPAVRSEIIAHMSCVIPTKGILNKFHDIATNMFTAISNNQVTARKLVALRDTLLPRLISGRLRLPEAEEPVEANSQ